MSATDLRAWVVDDDESIRWVLEQALRQADIEVTCFTGAVEFLDALAQTVPDVVVTDVRMPGMTGLELMENIHAAHPELPVIVITAHSDLDSAVSAYHSGAFEYLPKPFDVDDAVELVERAGRQRSQTSARTGQAADQPLLIGRAASMQQVFKSIGRLSRSSMTALITGESGTGKELVARALHENSPRAERPFIALNTSAVAAELLESELFGHEKGAFTGASERRAGRFEQADGGTLFLDEIGDMSAALQTRLLRVLAEGEFYRVGGTVPINVDVRVIAATHQDLSSAVEDGSFREDLYHRLNVMRIEVPPLRERREDIPELMRIWLERAGDELGVPIKSLSPEVATALLAYDWPGNVRELVNICRRLSVTAAGREIVPADLPQEITGPVDESGNDWTSELRRWADAQLRDTTQPLLDSAVPSFERVVIEAALQAANGKRREAAKLLGWGRNTLTRKIKELGLED